MADIKRLPSRGRPQKADIKSGRVTAQYHPDLGDSGQVERDLSRVSTNGTDLRL